MIYTAIPAHRIAETFRRRDLFDGSSLLCVLVPKMNGRGDIAVAIEKYGMVTSLHWHQTIGSAWEAFDREYKERTNERAASSDDARDSKNHGRNRKGAK